MSTCTLGSLFTGYGGLDMAVEAALGPARLAWASDIEPGPTKLHAHHHPGVPNLGDITQIDWAKVEPVDVIAGGSPCQDLSQAGRRAGMKPGTRSGLWESMLTAITAIRPRLVVWENVLGALSAPAFSLMEPHAGRVGDRANEPILRAIGRVCGDLAQIGYDAQWTTVAASDVGAPHQRRRVFLTAHPVGDWWWHARVGDADRLAANAVSVPRCTEGQSTTGETRGTHNPLVRRGGAPAEALERSAPLPTVMTANNDNIQSSGYGPNLGSAVVKLMPTLKASDGEFGTPMTSGRPAEKSTHLATRLQHVDWAQYRPAIKQWEHVLGRDCPPALTPNSRGTMRLSPVFCEWLMGLPEGHVTSPDAGLTHKEQIRALGNGVVPQQGAAALRQLADMVAMEAVNAA